jgi:hypothetical protein
MIAFTIPVVTSFMQTMIEKTTGFFHNPKHEYSLSQWLPL